MTREAFKKVLIEGGLGEEAAEQILDSFDKFKAQLEEGTQAKIDEGVKAVRIEIEAGNIKKLEEQKAEAETKLEEELATYEKRLAERVKSVVEAYLTDHGYRVLRVVEASEAKKGSALLEEIGEYVTQAKLEIAETTADPEEVKALKETVAEQKAEIQKLNEQHTHQEARANVAEQEILTLKEAVVVDQPVSVVVEDENKPVQPDNSDSEPAKTTPAEQDHPDSQPISDEPIVENEGPEMTPTMKRMRQMAGIEKKD